MRLAAAKVPCVADRLAFIRLGTQCHFLPLSISSQ